MKKILITIIITFGIILPSIAQTSGMKIVTGNPDFKIKITRCEASGKTVVIDMIWENISSQDVKIGIYADWDNMTFAWDDEGNKFAGRDISASIANGPLKGLCEDILPAEIPIRVKLKIENVPESATMFRRIDLTVRCDKWGLDHTKPVRITNLPINREGD